MVERDRCIVPLHTFNGWKIKWESSFGTFWLIKGCLVMRWWIGNRVDNKNVEQPNLWPAYDQSDNLLLTIPCELMVLTPFWNICGIYYAIFFLGKMYFLFPWVENFETLRPSIQELGWLGGPYIVLPQCPWIACMSWIWHWEAAVSCIYWRKGTSWKELNLEKLGNRDELICHIWRMMVFFFAG